MTDPMLPTPRASSTCWPRTGSRPASFSSASGRLGSPPWREGSPRRVTISAITRGAILDLHDADGVPGAGVRLLEALPGMIAAIRSLGLSLVPLRELL